MNGDPIIGALDAQLGCYQRLAKLAQIQHECVRQSRTEQLLEVLTSRQDVLRQVAQYEQVLEPVKNRWGEYLASLPPGERERAQLLLSETRRLLEQITAADKDDALVLQQRKLNLGREIQKAASARQFNRTYAAAAYGRRQSKVDVQQ
jgi:hypothetical protein